MQGRTAIHTADTARATSPPIAAGGGYTPLNISKIELAQRIAFQ
jgi:hypothetical protein